MTYDSKDAWSHKVFVFPCKSTHRAVDILSLTSVSFKVYNVVQISNLKWNHCFLMHERVFSSIFFPLAVLVVVSFGIFS